MHEVLVNRLGGLSLPRKSVVRLTDRPDMTLDVYRGRKTTIQSINLLLFTIISYLMLDFYVKTRIRFSLRDKRLFEITEVEITRVDCISFSLVD